MLGQLAGLALGQGQRSKGVAEQGAQAVEAAGQGQRVGGGLVHGQRMDAPPPPVTQQLLKQQWRRQRQPRQQQQRPQQQLATSIVTSAEDGRMEMPAPGALHPDALLLQASASMPPASHPLQQPSFAAGAAV